jgi:hypothetical protein
LHAKRVKRLRFFIRRIRCHAPGKGRVRAGTGRWG